MLPIDRVEPGEVHPLPPEQLNRRHARDVLLQERVDSRDQAAHGPVGLADIAPEPLRDEEDERQHRERDQRQPPVHPQHHAHDAGQREHVAEDRHNARREQIVQHVHVRRHPRHQPADRIAIVVPQIELLQVPVDGHPEVVHDPLARQLERPGLEVFGAERGDEDRQVERGQPVESGQLPLSDVPVDGDFDQIWLDQGRHRADDEGHEGEGDLPPGTAGGTGAAAA